MTSTSTTNANATASKAGASTAAASRTNTPAASATSLVNLPAPVRDIGLLLTRVLLGVVLIAHGWQKIVTNGIGGTGDFFASVGVPAADIAATFAGLVELVGGILLVIGVLTPVVAVLVAVVMAGAVVFVHYEAGIYAADGGWELVAVIGLAVVVFGLVGPGRYSLDSLIAGRRAAKA